MRVLIILFACLFAVPAESAPVIGLLAFGSTSTVGLSIFGVSIAAGTIGGAVLSLAGSLLLSAAARALAPKPPGAPDLVRELQLPDSLPPKRFVYGQARIYGSPTWRVKGGILYGVLILNSRPSEAVTGLYLDKRECTLTGDLYDFAGSGATASAAPFAGYVKVWVGLGDQTAAPDEIVAEAGEFFDATDAGEGLTVMWLRLDVGPNDSRATRWPRTPPEVEVEGQWSQVWDPREGAQDADDPATWTFSANQALCLLDALRQNPIRTYPLNQLLQDSFTDAADIADEAVPLKAGGTEPRYRVNGALIFNGAEILDQVTPLFDAGAAEPVRVGGRLGIAPGAWSAPIATISEITEAEGLSFQRLKPGRDLATTVRATFTAPDRDWRPSTLQDYTVPGAQDADGGVITTLDIQLGFVTSAPQAMRIQKIRANRQRAQRQIAATLPPAYFRVVAGGTVTVAFPAPYASLNGTYRVISANPGLFASEQGGGGVAMRVPVVLEEIAESDFAWTPATDEQTRIAVALDVARQPPEPPGAVGTTTGAAVAVIAGSTALPAIRFAFDPSPSSSVVSYEWEFQKETSDPFTFPWESGGVINADIRDGADQVFGTLSPAQIGLIYRIRVRAVGSSVSGWVTSADVAPTLNIPRYVADFDGAEYKIDGVAGLASNVVSVSRTGTASFVAADGTVQFAATNAPRIDHLTGVGCLLIEAPGGNDWTYSEDMANAAWTKARISVTANAATAPDGAATADKIIEDSSTNTHYLRRPRSYVSGVRADFVFHAKADERTALRIQCAGSGMTSQRADIDLTTGGVTIVAGSPDVAVYALASGWYRVEFGFVPNGSPSGFFDLLLLNGGAENYAGDGTSGLLLWGLQDGAGSYIPTSASAASRAADVPAMQGVSATLDLIATYDDATTAVFDNAPVLPGYWPTLTRPRLRSLIGTI